MPHDNPSSAEAASADAPSFAAAQETKRQRTRLIIRAVGMLPVLLLLCIGFHFLSDGRFFSGQNLGIVLQQAAVNTVLAAGMTFVILTGGIDLSVGSILAAAAMAGLIVSKFPDLGLLWLPAAVLAGLVFGVINGALIALLRLPPFIVTLGSLTAVRGMARLLGADTTVFNSTIPYAFIGNGSLTLLPGVVSIPWLSVIALLVILVSWLVLRRTVLGVHIYAVGGNESAARLAGIKVWAVLIFVYGVSGLLAGLGGAMQAARLYAANGWHLLRRRYRLDLGNAGRGLDHCRVVEWPHSHRCFRRVAICDQGSGDHRRRRPRPLSAAGLGSHLKDRSVQGSMSPCRVPLRQLVRRAGNSKRPGRKPMSKTISFAGAAMALVLSSAPSFAKELKSIGISLGSLGNPFFVALSKGAEFEARKSNPNVKITTVGFEYDLGKQVTQIDNFIAAGVDLILLNPGDPKAVGPAIKKAQAAGIIVVAVDTAAEAADATVTTNNVQAGEISCQYIVDKLGGKGDVIIENGPQVSAVIDRVVGCKNVFSKNPGLKVLSSDQDAKGSREGGLTVTQGYLTRFTKIDAIFAINDPQAIGTDLAARQQQRGGIIITAVDGAPDIEAALKDPEAKQIQASASQDPFFMARRAVQIGVGILNGQKPASTVELLPSKLVTRDNIAEYKGWTSDRSQ